MGVLKYFDGSTFNTIQTVPTDDSITTIKLRDLSVSTSKIVNGAITTIKLGSDSVTSSKINDGAVTTDKIAANAVTTAKLATNSVTGVKIAANAVTTAKLATNSVTGVKIAANAVANDNLAAAIRTILGRVPSSPASGSSGRNKVWKTNSSGTPGWRTDADAGWLYDVEFLIDDIDDDPGGDIDFSRQSSGDGSNIRGSIRNSAVTTAKLATNSVTGVKIAANAVTTAKLATNSVTGVKIAANAVANDNLAAAIRTILGRVPSDPGNANNNKVWKTSGSGVPGWRDAASGTSGVPDNSVDLTKLAHFNANQLIVGQGPGSNPIYRKVFSTITIETRTSDVTGTITSHTPTQEGVIFISYSDNSYISTSVGLGGIVFEVEQFLESVIFSGSININQVGHVRMYRNNSRFPNSGGDGTPLSATNDGVSFTRPFNNVDAGTYFWFRSDLGVAVVGGNVRIRTSTDITVTDPGVINGFIISNIQAKAPRNPVLNQLWIDTF